MRPTSAARDRGGLDPSSHYTSSSIQGALRGAQQSGSSAAGTGPPGLLLVLMLVAVALPAVSFFAMHARMLDRQEVLSNNYAVRDGPVRCRTPRDNRNPVNLKSASTPLVLNARPSLTRRRRWWN